MNHLDNRRQDLQPIKKIQASSRLLTTMTRETSLLLLRLQPELYPLLRQPMRWTIVRRAQCPSSYPHAKHVQLCSLIPGRLISLRQHELPGLARLVPWWQEPVWRVWQRRRHLNVLPAMQRPHPRVLLLVAAPVDRAPGVE